MFKFMCLLVASALIVEGLPTSNSDIVDAAKNGNWDFFQSLFKQQGLNNFPAQLAGSVESLKPEGNGHVYGHSVSTYKEWHNDNGKVSSKSDGLEVTNNDGEITRRNFQP